MRNLVVIGSGPGGAAAAIAAAKRGQRVLIIERGGEASSGPGKRTLGQLLNAIKRLDDLAPRVAGGGSAINYGVLASPTRHDVLNAVGPRASERVLSRFHEYLRAVGQPQATAPVVGPVHGQLAQALQTAWGLKPRTDQALQDPVEKIRSSNEETLLYNATAQPLQGFRRDQLSLAIEYPNVELWTRSEVRWLQAEESGAWTLHVECEGRGGACVSVRTQTVVLACGALETPRLLLASAAIAGRMPRGVSPHVGQHLVDHGRNQVLYEVRPGFSTTRYSSLPVLISHRGTHVEAIHYSGLDACSIATADCCARTCGCKTSRLLDTIPSWCVFDNGFSTETFDAFCCCCAPCGVAATFNPFRCVRDRMLLVVGRRTSVEGSVSITDEGKRVTTLPGYSSDDVEMVRAAILDIRRVIDAAAPSLQATTRSSSHFSERQTDTQWHFGGTARMSVDDDGAVDASFRLLDASGEPYTTLFIADNSVMRMPTTFNTQTMAALIGYCSGATAVEAMRRE